MENSSITACYNELIQIEHGEVRSQFKLRYVEALRITCLVYIIVSVYFLLLPSYTYMCFAFVC